MNLQKTLPSLDIGTKLIIYGEKMDSKLFTFVHPVYHTQDFLPIYERSTYHPQDMNNSIVQPILNEIFGLEEQSMKEKKENELLSSAQILPPSNIKSELELIDIINHENNNGDRDLIGEFKNAAEERMKLLKEKKKQQHQSIRISKLKPVKYNSSNINTIINDPSSIFEEKKITLKRMIKDAMPDTSGENRSIFQIIYSSIRHTCRLEFESSNPLDEAKLQCIIKLHVDFYNNLENIISIFYPDNNS
ncbi:unnamed protein product [Mucor hiemalis]